MIICRAGASLVTGHGGTRDLRTIAVIRTFIIMALEKVTSQFIPGAPGGALVSNLSVKSCALSVKRFKLLTLNV